MPRRIAKWLIISPERRKINDARKKGRSPEAIGRMVTPHNSHQKAERADFFCRVRNAFRVFARRSSEVLGTAWAFIGAIVIIVVWGLTGPTFHFSDTWQLIINTGTTIVTFLMVFLIQNTGGTIHPPARTRAENGRPRFQCAHAGKSLTSGRARFPRFAIFEKNLSTGTKIEDFTIAAIGLAGKAAATAVPDQPVTPER